MQVGASLCFTLPVTTGGEISDPEPGSPLSSTPANEIIFPVAARVVGIGGSEWRTDLRVLNHGSTPVTVNVEWYPFAPEGRPGPAQVVPVIVNPGVQGVYNDSLQSLFNTAGGGSLRLVSASFEIGAALRLYDHHAAHAAHGAGRVVGGAKRVFILDETAGDRALLP